MDNLREKEREREISLDTNMDTNIIKYRIKHSTCARFFFIGFVFNRGLCV